MIFISYSLLSLKLGERVTIEGTDAVVVVCVEVVLYLDVVRCDLHIRDDSQHHASLPAH